MSEQFNHSESSLKRSPELSIGNADAPRHEWLGHDLFHLPGTLAGAVFDGAVQRPLNGVSQLINRATGTHALPEINVVKAPSAEFGTVNWYAEQLGGAVGMAAPFLLVHKGIGGLGKVAAKPFGFGLAEGGAWDSQQSLLRPLLHTAISGGVYGGVFEPVEGDQKSFLGSRLANAGSTAATFAALGIGARGLSELSHLRWLEGTTGGNILGKPAIQGLLSGLPAGALGAETSSLFSGNGWASGKDVFQSAYGNAIVGGTLGALHGLPGKRLPQESVYDSVNSQQKARVGLFYDGGGVGCFGLIGALKYADEHGIKFDYEYGSSVGALVATIHTSGLSGAKAQECFLREFAKDPLQSTLPQEVNLRTLIGHKELRDLFKYFEDNFPIGPNDKLGVAALKPFSRKHHIFTGNNWNWPEGMAASAAIFPAFKCHRVEIGTKENGKPIKRLLIDGGFKNVTASDLPPAENLVIFSLQPPEGSPTTKQTAGQALYKMAAKATSKMFNSSQDRGTDLIVRAGMPGVPTLGFKQSDATYRAMIDHGYKQAEKVLGPAIASGRIPVHQDDFVGA